MFLNRFATIIILAMFCASGARAAIPSTFNVYLTTEADGAIESAHKDRRFECDDVIYLFVESGSASAADSSIKATWMDPAGVERVVGRRGFERGSGGYWAWSGLQLSRPSGASLLQILDPSAGMEAFIGDWTVRVEVDGRNVASMQFNVLC